MSGIDGSVNFPPRPLAISFAAMMFIAYSSYKIFKYRKQIENLKLALEGERAVGEYLDRFREKDFVYLMT